MPPKYSASTRVRADGGPVHRREERGELRERALVVRRARAAEGQTAVVHDSIAVVVEAIARLHTSAHAVACLDDGLVDQIEVDVDAIESVLERSRAVDRISERRDADP